MKGKRIIIGVSITFCVLGLIWFGGWAVWTQFHLWDSMKNFEYENALYVLMILTMLLGGGLTYRKSKTAMARPDMNKKIEAPVQNPVDLAPFKKRLDEMEGKVADIYTIIKFLKKSKEKNGGEKA